ncbi:hypothetical protein [Altererythrobacter sp. MF3-039]|uniref:hypothetical protein n=1 Tax=Altererythrobacter sp. MF3-039 TaxID=3252901 RepID=UPI00390C4204
MDSIANNPAASNAFFGIFSLFIGLLGVTADGSTFQTVVGALLLVFAVVFFVKAVRAKRSAD